MCQVCTSIFFIQLSNCTHYFIPFSTAPGTYCPEKVNLDKGPQYSISGKHYVDKKDDVPGKETIMRFCL